MNRSLRASGWPRGQTFQAISIVDYAASAEESNLRKARYL